MDGGAPLHDLSLGGEDSLVADAAGIHDDDLQGAMVGGFLKGIYKGSIKGLGFRVSEN